ncbi:MAG: metallophosphoesterase [Deltaproteobacteria bacterium]|jgi:predicted MPP superfamily phosphohydrolase|nr:metallophosphoesterase [Deltaproteobacteria bacterium]
MRFWLYLIGICFLAQLVTLAISLKFFQSRPAKLGIKFAFLFFNLLWAVCVYLFYSKNMDGAWWVFVGRPALSWELSCVILMIPVAAVGAVWFLYRAIVWILYGPKRFWKDKASSGGAKKVPPSGTQAWERLLKEGNIWGQSPGANKAAQYPDPAEDYKIKVLKSGEGKQWEELPKTGQAGEKLSDPSPGPADQAKVALAKTGQAKTGPAKAGQAKTGQAKAGQTKTGPSGPGGVGLADPGRRGFLKKAGAASLLAYAGLCGFGVLAQTAKPNVNRKVLSFPGLPGDLDGFKICHLTDLHLGMWSSSSELGATLEVATSEKPDLVVITGDLVDRDPENARLYRDPLRILEGVPHGVFAVLGNHDHYAGAQSVTKLLNGNGLRMLVEERVRLKEAPITIVGLDDQNSGSWMGFYSARKRQGLETDPDVLTFKRLAGPSRRNGDFSLLLNHRPEGYRQASQAGFDLYLAGHTHGGQYQIPWDSQDNLAAYFYRYSSGLYDEYPCYLNVSRGLASVGLPYRLFAWHEIDLLTLRKA